MGTRRRSIRLALAVGCCALAAAAPPASAWEFVTGPPKTEKAAWKPGTQPRNQERLGVRVSSGYCAGEQPPFISRVEVREKRRRTIVTAYLRFPTPVEVSGEVKPGEPLPVCLGIGYDLEEVVELDRPRTESRLFDGSFSPPRRVPLPD
ncbi:MAG TPA: hypothetical protein VD741_01660 [Solirubrobacterales bacterium]|nr:hypothetical protein [Solirubrobacterales bacterium]